MITGVHAVLYSKDAAADRAFFRDILGFPAIDAGDGWLIFALPPAELGVHPAEVDGGHELYLLCDDVAATMTGLADRGVGCEPVSDQGWGLMTKVPLPGGGRLGLYQPRHATAHGGGGG